MNVISKQERRHNRYLRLRDEVMKNHPEAGPNRVVRKGFTKLCIEGFPRSANSFFARAMAIMNEPNYKRSRVAHHIHDVRNLELAVLAGVPAVALIREPISAISSSVIYLELSVREMVERYHRFYSGLNLLLGKLLVVDFKMVIGDMNHVVSLINDSFALDYAYADNVEALRDSVFDEIKRTASDRHKGNLSSRVGMPSEEREARKLEVRQEVERNPKIQECVDLYHAALQEAGLVFRRKNAS